MTRTLTILVALVVSASVFVAGCSTGGGSSSKPSADTFGSASTSAAPASAAPASAAPSSAPAGSGSASGSCPTAPPAAMAAGTKRVVTIETAKGKIEITVEADLGPLAAGNFIALVSCGFYDGLVFHRVVPGFVIQGGDPTGTGSGGPGYAFADDPVNVPYARGVVAMANSGANTNGYQFFIVLADAGLDPKYSVFGRVTAGLDAVDAIAAAADAENPTNPIKMDKVTVAP